MPPDRQLFRGQAQVRYALEILGVVALAGFIFFNVLSFIARIQTVAIILIGALFFTYLIYPAVHRLNRRVPLGAAIAIVYAAIALIVIFGASVLLPALGGNIRDFAANAPSLAHNVETSLADPANPFVAHLPGPAQHYLAKLPANLTLLAARYGAETASRTLEILLSTFSLVALFIVIPVVAAYMLLEAEDLKRSVVGMIPARARPRTLTIISDLDKVIGGFIRGQLIVAATVGALITILLLVLHVNYALLIGIAAGILDVIPYVGALAGWLPAFFIALFTNGWQNALFVTIGIVVVNQLEGHIIAPNVVSKSVELTPLIVVIALIAGGELMGIPGLLIAVPIAGVIRVLIMNFRPPKPVTEAELRSGDAS